MKETKFEFSMSGFVISLLVVSMLAGVFGGFITDLEAEYNVDSSLNFSKYETSSNKIRSDVEAMRKGVEINPEEDSIDVIGGYFRSGWSGLKVAFGSFSLFDAMTEQASKDVEAFAYFRTYIFAIILVGLLIGIIMAVLVKMRT